MMGSEAKKAVVEAEQSARARPVERPPLQLVRKVEIDRSRDSLLTDFGRTTLEDRYLLPGESYQDMFARVATAYADDAEHAQRIYDYISQLWFMPSTPVLSNGGAGRGLPISCFLNAVSDSLESIVGTWNENVFLASNGGGIGTYWGGVRSIGEKVKGAGQTSGIIPFIRVMDSLTLAISQGSLRRGNAAVYIDIWHPEIEEFVEIRKPSGDFNRKSLNLHHGVCITTSSWRPCATEPPIALRSPKTGEVIREVDARSLWQKLLELRLQTGEPYLVFSDTANRALPQHQRELGLKVRQSNLCSEILLHSGPDHLGRERTAVCCLSSVNAEMFLEWRDHPTFIEDCMRFLDNVLQDFIDRAPPEMEHAAYAAWRERSVGLGLMGFHSFLQGQNVPFESALAKSWNMRLFKHLRRGCDAASRKLAEERGPCPDAAERGVMERFSHKLAIAPNASTSIICGGTSAGIEPIPANIYTHKTLSGSFAVKNPYLERLLGGARRQHRPGLELDPGERGLGAASRLPLRRREGRLQDRLRDRPALDHRAGRRPRARYLPVAVGQHLPARRRRQMGPAHAALVGVGARREEPLLPALQVGAARRLRRRRRHRRADGEGRRRAHRLRRVPGLPIGLRVDFLRCVKQA